MRFLAEPSSVQLGPLAWLFLAVIVVLLPLVALRQHRRLTTGSVDVTRTQIYASAMATHAVFLLMVWGVAHDGSIDLFPSYRLSALHVVVGGIALALGLLPGLERFRLSDPIARERTGLIAPRTPRERGAFYLLSVSAGVAEEVTYRGLLFTLLAALAGGWWPAALLSATVFGIVHLFQGWRGAGIAALMGLREQLVVGLTGTLVVAMVVHMLHDIIAGTLIGIHERGWRS